MGATLQSSVFYNSLCKAIVMTVMLQRAESARLI
jgi:hypothetical protein